MFTLISKPGNIYRYCILASFVCFLFGIYLPLFSLQKMFVLHDTFSLLGGAFSLIRNGETLLFVVIFMFSVLMPLYKYFILWKMATQNNFTHKNSDKNHLAAAKKLASIGKWSMADVFLLAILAATLKLGGLASVQAHIGIVFFVVSVMSAMYLSHKAMSPYELTIKAPIK